jgi:LacI family transcriptional regulator
MSVTIKEIAKIAGLCPATIDKVIHHRPGVKEATRRRVQQVLADLDYKPNIAGRALKLQQKKLTIVVILIQVDAFLHIMGGIQEQLETVKNFGLEVETHSVPYSGAEAQAQLLMECSQRDISGVVLQPLNDERVTAAINELAKKEIPVITVNSDVPDSARTCFIGQNWIQAGRTAAHLMARFLSGAGTVAVVTGSRELIFDLYRLKGFSEHLQQNYPDINLLKVLETREDALVTYQKTAELLHEHPDINGIFITCGRVKDVGQAVSALGFAGRVSIVCFDLYDDIRELIHKGIIDCTIGQDLHKQGAYPVQLFFQRLYHNLPLPSGEIFTPIDIRVAENIDYPANC